MARKQEPYSRQWWTLIWRAFDRVTSLEALREIAAGVELIGVSFTAYEVASLRWCYTRNVARLQREEARVEAAHRAHVEAFERVVELVEAPERTPPLPPPRAFVALGLALFEAATFAEWREACAHIAKQRSELTHDELTPDELEELRALARQRRDELRRAPLALAS